MKVLSSIMTRVSTKLISMEVIKKRKKLLRKRSLLFIDIVKIAYPIKYVTVMLSEPLIKCQMT
jgi:hypothetical protein